MKCGCLLIVALRNPISLGVRRPEVKLCVPVLWKRTKAMPA